MISTLAPVHIRVPAGMVLTSDIGDTSGLRVRHQVWIQDSAFFLGVTRFRLPSIPGARSIPLRSPSQQVEFCRASSGGLEGTLETRRVVVPRPSTADSAGAYMMTVKFGLAENDTLQLDGIALTRSDQQRLLAIIQSVYLVEGVGVHR